MRRAPMPVATHIYHCYCVTAPFCSSEGTSEMSFHISVDMSLLLFVMSIVEVGNNVAIKNTCLLLG